MEALTKERQSTMVLPKKEHTMWKDIKGYKGLYQISNQGEVKSFAKGGTRILKPEEGKYGHKRVTLSKGTELKRFLVHRLVAMHFIDGDDSLEVNHKDSNPRNNHYLNLEWSTHQENAIHGYEYGYKRKAVESAGKANRKLSQEQIEEIKNLKSTTSLSNVAIGKKYNVGREVIRRLIKGDTYGY